MLEYPLPVVGFAALWVEMHGKWWQSSQIPAALL